MRTVRPAAPAPPPTESAARPPVRLVADVYLTDESSLFRCVAADLSGDPDGTALLEDCRTLQTCVVRLAELDRSALRLVRA